MRARRALAVLATAMTMAAATSVPAAPACSGRSGPQTTALVELYTSEGCSSCPPADRWLATLPSPRISLQQAVPLGLHVDYWDYIGWKDAFARPEFAERQRRLVEANRRRTSYTPHFFVSGVEVRGGTAGLEEAIARAGSRPARADIEIAATLAGGRLAVDARAHARDADAKNRPLALYLALTESGLVTQVKAGENGGATLHHGHVVRQWIGPLPLAAGSIVTHREVALDAGWARPRLTLTAFVQDGRSEVVLQALALTGCAGN